VDGQPLKIKLHLTFHELERRQKSAKRIPEYRYWLIIRLMALELERPYGLGPTYGTKPLNLRKIADYTGYSVKQIRCNVNAYNQKGPDAFLPKRRRLPSTGRRRLLDETQEHKLYAALATGMSPESQSWTAERVQGWLKEELGVHVNRSTAWRYMNRYKTSHL